MLKFLKDIVGKSNFEKVEQDFGEFEDQEESNDYLRREKKRQNAIKHGLAYTITLKDLPLHEQVKYTDDWNE